jgi:hypothetical protein
LGRPGGGIAPTPHLRLAAPQGGRFCLGAARRQKKRPRRGVFCLERIWRRPGGRTPSGPICPIRTRAEPGLRSGRPARHPSSPSAHCGAS